jgi:P2 family phage contractile tail tube protein
MSLPKKLKNYNVFADGESFAGLATEVTLPKLTRKTEDYQAGGMSGPVASVLGLEKLEMPWKVAGFDKRLFTQWKSESVDGVLLRFAAALQDESTAGIEALEVVVRGVHTELDFGTAKVSEKLETSVTSALSYYKVTLGGQTVIEIDFVNMIEIIDGEDLAAAVRTAIGL